MKNLKTWVVLTTLAGVVLTGVAASAATQDPTDARPATNLIPWNWDEDGVTTSVPTPKGGEGGPATPVPTQTPHANPSDTPPGRSPVTTEPSNAPTATPSAEPTNTTPPPKHPDCYDPDTKQYWPWDPQFGCTKPPKS